MQLAGNRVRALSLFVCVCCVFSGCNAKKEQTNQSLEASENINYAAMKLSQPPMKEVLSADEISEIVIDYTETVPADDLFAGTKETSELQEELFSFIRDSIRDEEDCHDAASFYGESGCYVSKRSLRCWDAANNKMDKDDIVLFVFSKDFKKLAKVTMILENGKSAGLTWEYDTTFMDKLQANPKESYIFLYNGKASGILDKNNVLTLSGTNEEVVVEGDYYHALDYKEISISYEKLTDKKNMIWLDIKDK